MFFLYKERTKEIPNQYNHRTGQLPSLRQLPGFGLCMDVSGVGCRAASPLAAARGVLPCGANLFLKGAIGGKKCEYPHKLEFDTLYLSRILLNHFAKRDLLKIMNLYSSPFFILTVAIGKTTHFQEISFISCIGKTKFLYFLSTVSLFVL